MVRRTQNEKKLNTQLEILEKLLAHPSWGKSHLLSVVKGRLEGHAEAIRSKIKLLHMRSNRYKDGRSLVHVLLFHRSADLCIWERMLNSVERCVLGRPAYADLDKAKQSITSLGEEAILSIWVKPESLHSVQGLEGDVYKQLHEKSLSNLHIECLTFRSEIYSYQGRNNSGSRLSPIFQD